MSTGSKPAASGGDAAAPRVEQVPIDRIRILNPRSRGRAKFRQIVASIDKVGLKRPITVSPRRGSAGYDLVCGQGRLEALVALGQTEVPALVVDLSVEDRYLRSLVENLARRQPSSTLVMEEIARLQEQGDSNAEIATKLGMSRGRVGDLQKLHQGGEGHLLAGVESGDLPTDIALEIARSSDKQVQRILEQAYRSGQLRGKALARARRLVEGRRGKGKSKDGKSASSGKKRQPQSADALVRAYRRETQRQKLLVKKARLCDARLTFLVNALKSLVEDQSFVALLRKEGLNSMPKFLAERLAGLE